MAQLSGRILIVDDHARNVAILAKILGSHYRLATASSGEEALQVASRFLPDLVLLDIMMPGIDGYETCRRLRAVPEQRYSKIILLSAKAMLSERLAGYEAGADDYITKPFDEDELLVKIRVYMRLKSVQELDSFKTQIITLLNHETRTPLTTILTPLELVLSDGERLSNEQRELLHMAQKGALRLNAFVDGVNLLNEVQSGQVRLEPSRYDLAGIVRGALDGLGVVAESRSVRFETDLPENLFASCDFKHVTWAIAALADNAVRFSPSPGVVFVRLDRMGDLARISVIDRGAGIPPHFMDQLFEGLAVPDICHHQSGKGLGLVTARAIVARHEGRLAAHNDPEGGAVFEMYLPLAPSAAAAPWTAADSPADDLPESRAA